MKVQKRWGAREILKFRKAHGMQQSELAERLGIGQSYISQLEAGDKVPSKTLCLLLNCLAKELDG